MSVPDRIVMKISRIPDQESSGILLPIASNIRSSVVIDPDFTKKKYAYKPSKFCVAFDTEKVLEAGCSGLNTRAGDLLTVKFKYDTPAASGAVAAAVLPT